MTVPRTDWTTARRESASLNVHLLGLVDLEAAHWLQQNALVDIAERHDHYGELLICEHPLAITVGRQGSASDLSVDRADLLQKGVPVEWQRRGGGTWVHHPGQIMAYVVLPVSRRGLNAADAAQRLEAALNDVARESGIVTHPASDRPGCVGRCGQFGFVGAAMRDGVSQFGLCLNVSIPRGPLGLVRWNATGRASSLSTERMRPVSMATVRESLIRHVASAFQYDRYQLLTSHPRLQRTTRRLLVSSEPAHTR